MRETIIHLRLAMVSLLLLVGLCGAATAGAQQPTRQEPSQTTENAIEARKPSTKENAPAKHRFWDKENCWLFAGVGASRALDYSSTLNMRRRGVQEILLSNDVVDNHAAFSAIEAAGTGTSIGASFLFHRYGHHKLERWTSFVHIGVTTTGAVRNYCLKTIHRTITP
ncbi:MAG TPA: hypothetical protein VFI60_11780 [Candidatus Acidoferrum sp.]|nr:hypothetical protein [Candidatus Acidoferrum sp.]